MTDAAAITAQNVSQGATAFNRPILSQYLDEDYSIFGNPRFNSGIGTSPVGGYPANPGMTLGGGVGYGTGMGMGMGMFGGYTDGSYVDSYVDNAKRYSNGMYDLAGHESDNKTSLTFKDRGNAYTLNTTSEILTNTLKNMKYHISENDLQTATEEFDQICSAIGKESGLELKTQQERVDAEQSIRSAVAKYYDQVNGGSLRDDIMHKGHGFFMNGVMAGLRGGDYGKNSAEETFSYMTGTGIQSYASKNTTKKIGKAVGYATPALAGAAAGFAIGGPVGAVVGGVAGLAYTLISSAIGKEENDHVTTY